MNITDFISFDNLIFISIILVLFFVSFKYGKKTLTALIISTYPAILFFKNIPFIKLNDQTAAVLALIIIYAICVSIIWRNLHVKKLHSIYRKILDNLALAISFVILIISIQINSIPAISVFYNFPNFAIELVSKIPFGVALALPLVLILITNKGDA